MPAATQEQLTLLRSRLEGLLAYLQEHAAEVFLPAAEYLSPDDPGASGAGA